ncbi:protein kinase domain-containing protein [Streptosporangium sandarakinum]|uniref:protein kinase domain-containing protein n=1 Tax=Streptosporangium sandarakinum TaxID=1260955 RepID=UPI00342AF9C3
MVPGYREVRELGGGGGGRVVLATYEATGAYVAIKYLGASLRDSPGFLAGFRRDARVLAELRDPNVVSLHEYYEDVIQAAIVMELVDGVSLRRILARHGALGPEAALVVLRDSLAGLAAAHAAGVAHRGHRPENVLVQADGTAKLADLGVAARTAEPGPPGGPRHAAPGRRDGRPGGPAGDLYAAACVFFECLTGRPPYGTALTEPAVPAEPAEPTVPAELAELVARGLAEDPADRPATAREFAADLEAVASAACGPGWERRGRQLLAELAIGLALAFPLARTAPKAGVPRPPSAAGRPGETRRPRLGPRIVAAAGVIGVAVATGLVVAGRVPDRLASDTVFTPAPGHPAGGGTAASGDRRTTRPAAHERSRGSVVPSPSPGPPRSTAPGRTAPPAPTGPGGRADRPVSPAPTGGPGRPGPTARPSRPEPTPAASGPGHPGPTAPEGRPSPTPTTTAPGRPSPSEPTASPGTPSPAGPSPTLSPGVPAAEVEITSFDGAEIGFRVRAADTSAVTVRLGFAQKVVGGEGGLTGGVRTLTLSGLTEYTRRISGEFAALPPCGEYVHRLVTAAVVPGGEMRSRDVRLDLPACGQDAASGPSDRSGVSGLSGSSEVPDPPETW